ncbi:MAG: lamin tail domain-containing protein [Flavobacteriales bacterium]
MRCRSLLPLFLWCAALAANAQFVDTFADGDFTSGPAWDGDAAVFVVNASQQLQLNNTVAGTSQLRSANAMATLDDMEWRMRVKLSFSGSASNFARVHLVSDQADLTGPLNGYFLQFGEAGSADAIELFEQTGTDIGSICRGTEGAIAGAFDVGVRVKRSASGVWELSVDPSGGNNYAVQATGLGTAHTTNTTIGVRCTYTVSNADNFFFDDFYAGPTVVDTQAPTVVSATFTSAVDVDVRFSEAVDEVSAEQVANYALSPSIAINSATRDGIDPALVHLGLASALSNGTTYVVTATGVQDLAGNIGGASSGSFTYAVPATAGFRDVVINEFMADPTPVVGLPEAEFVELYNTTTDRVFELEGWTFSDGGTPVPLPAYTLAPGAYVVLMTTASLPLFPGITNKLGLPSLPALNNDGDALELRDDNATIIDAVTYALSWYQDAIKDDGGWTLEQIDPTSPCSGAANWRASNAALGGTPGAQNSIYAIIPDNTPPTLMSVQVPDANTLVLTFNEALDVASVADGVYTISPAAVVASAVATGSTSANLNLSVPLVAGTIYTIQVGGVADCPGNPIGAGNSASFALPEPLSEGDVVINEVLYDPIGSGSDFVELYNRSTKVISLAGLQLANVSDGVVGPGAVITANAELLLPGAYVLVCEDAADVVTNYPQSRTDRFVVADLPSYNNGEGSVVFLGADGSVLDRFDYNDDLHFELVNNTEGYSLERVDPDRNTDDPTNWQTAADIAGKATPGFVNSQFAETTGADGELTIEPTIFSPDNDGFQDVLTIAYSFNEPGYVGTLVVYDLAGREARRLMDNLLLGTEGAISWDGILEGGGLARMGPYIVVLEVFDLAGNVQKFKKTVTLAHRLD